MDKIGLNIKEAAQYLGISKELLRKLVDEEEFPCIKFKRRILINKNKLEEWIESNSGKYIG